MVVGPESLPGIAEGIDWDKIVDFFRHLIQRPDETLPATDTVAADGAGAGSGKTWDSPEGQQEQAEYWDASVDAGHTYEELSALIDNPPRDFANAREWRDYIQKVINKEKELLPLLEKLNKEGLEMAQYGHSYDPSDNIARIQVLQDSIADLEDIKGLFGGFNLSLSDKEYLRGALERELNSLVIDLEYPRQRILSSAE